MAIDELDTAFAVPVEDTLTLGPVDVEAAEEEEEEEVGLPATDSGIPVDEDGGAKPDVCTVDDDDEEELPSTTAAELSEVGTPVEDEENAAESADVVSPPDDDDDDEDDSLLCTEPFIVPREESRLVGNIGSCTSRTDSRWKSEQSLG